LESLFVLPCPVATLEKWQLRLWVLCKWSCKLPPPPNKHLAKFTATYIKAQAPSVATHFGETYLAAKFGRPEILQKCSLGLSIHVSEELQQWSVGYEQLLHSRSISIYEGR
jgi:hypothetical protein